MIIFRIKEGKEGERKEIRMGEEMRGSKEGSEDG